jgi:hypothetical protein
LHTLQKRIVSRDILANCRWIDRAAAAALHDDFDGAAREHEFSRSELLLFALPIQ